MIGKSDIAFRHYRKVEPDGSVSPRGGATIAYRKGAPTIFAAAYCSESDNFAYATGRKIAMDRLRAHLSRVSPFKAVDEAMEKSLGYQHIIRAKNKPLF